jgi:hypothetical protein
MRRLAVVLVLAAIPTWAADPDLMKLVMPGARFIAGIHVAQVRKTPFGQFILSEFSASQDREFDGFVKASGFDPRYNLDDLVIAGRGLAFDRPGSDSGHNLLVARGTFSPDRIIAIARSAGAAIENFQGIDIIGNSAAPPASPSRMPLALAFLSNSIAVAGDRAAVRGAISRRMAVGGGSGPDIASAVEAVSSADDAWFVSTVPAGELVQGLPGNFGAALQDGVLKSVRQATGGATFGQTVRISVQLLTGTAEDASSLAGMFHLLSGFAQSGPDPLWTSLDLKADGNVVKVGLSLSEAQLESLLARTGH